MREISGFYFLNKSNLILKNKQKIINKLVAFYRITRYSYYLLKPKNIFNYQQYLFMIKSNNKQYFLSFLGYNILYFKTASTGKILKRKNLITKSLKSSQKANKYLLLFFNECNSQSNVFISYYLLKPVNRKNLNFFYLVLKAYRPICEFFGFYQYYNITTKKVKRIKKRVKKKLLSKHSYFN